MKRPDEIHRLLRALSDELAAEGHRAEIVILGAGSLIARGLGTRATADIDVLGLRLPDGTVRTAFPLPSGIRDAADRVASALNLNPLWLDDRPGSDFHNAAPEGFEKRLERETYDALDVWHLSRLDIVAIKIVASAERWGEPNNKHWEDVQSLVPDADAWALAEAFAARVWADQSAAWAALEKIRTHLGTHRAG